MTSNDVLMLEIQFDKLKRNGGLCESALSTIPLLLEEIRNLNLDVDDCNNIKIGNLEEEIRDLEDEIYDLKLDAAREDD